jgi:two-component system, sensor histidine kinase and response regulator
VSGFSGILRTEFSAQMPADATALLDHVCSAAHRMEQLIDDLLRFSRLGRRQIARGPVSVSALVREVLEELPADGRDRPVETRLGDLPDCLGDAPLLKQVLVNLLSNAFKFTRTTEKPIVEIGCTSAASLTTYFVRDNGAGFDMRYADKLFGMFQRLHGQHEFEGTGVGLSIAQRIIQRHGGRIWAESEVGKGATFYFTLAG